MKLLFSGDWLRRRISTACGPEPEAGLSIGELASPRDNDSSAKTHTLPSSGVTTAVQSRELRKALGVVVRDLRLKQGLSISELAARAQISKDELQKVEEDPSYTARPRLIYQLSKYFDFPLATLSQMSGATEEVDPTVCKEVLKYAAYSDGRSSLSEEQKEVLDNFVCVVNERCKVLT